jgi:hypothetical protein
MAWLFPPLGRSGALKAKSLLRLFELPKAAKAKTKLLETAFVCA